VFENSVNNLDYVRR